MIFRREELPQLLEDKPETGVSGLSDSNGTWMEETPSDLLLASELQCNTVEARDNEESYSPDQVGITCFAGENVHRGRRRREQMSEDNTEEAPPRRRQRLEQEDEDDELIDFAGWERSLSPSWHVSPTLPFVPAEDTPSSRANFWMRMRVQMSEEEDNNEEDTPRSRQHEEQEDTENDLERSSSSFSLTFHFFHTKDSAIYVLLVVISIHDVILGPTGLVPVSTDIPLSFLVTLN
ncbi:uncharacterized protein LOC108255455 [Ictalurus punctatus]|uniref:Uncharacterized protein LOC108255455 n=1 Tax=Ictalurus punctatus TaxID=7998 RepID=A0A2D0PP74_ICTPU|nr:uncharacterized protein LOC108255455 [Ictalurus punctatus]